MLLFAWGMAALANAQATDLIISEYVEGSGNNKYIELYNGTGASIDLTNYKLRLYTNGASTPTNDVLLAGTLAAGGTIVYRNSGATLYGGTTTINAAVGFNGNDAIALWKVSTSSFVDIFGQIGCDPGTRWQSGVYQTLDKTLVRKTNICNGVTTNPGGTCGIGSFPTLTTEWDQYNVDDVTHLGSHIMTCGPTVTFDDATSTELEDAGTVTVNLTISPAAPANGSITITIGGTSTATYGGANDYTTSPVGPTTITIPVLSGDIAASFDVTINDDALNEGDETIKFTITSVSTGFFIGAADEHVLTIEDNDFVPTVYFETVSVDAIENSVDHGFTINLSTPHPAGTMTIQLTSSTGAVYGLANDYTTSINGAGGTFNISFAADAPTATFSATAYNDGIAEATDTVTFTIITVPSGFDIGTPDKSKFIIGDVNSPSAVLSPGDLLVLGVNANDNSCTPGADEISFFCFKEITYGTEIIITDNGYERCNTGSGLWGNQEGAVTMTRTGPTIPAGQVITFRITGSTGNATMVSLAPDAGWSCTDIGSVPGAPFLANFALNNGGEQLFFMQGTWNPGTYVGTYQNNATFVGNILFAFNTKPGLPLWQQNCSDPNRTSNLPPGVECFSMSPTLAADYNKYTGPRTLAAQRDWIIRVSNTAYWTSPSSCLAYHSLTPDWLAAPILPVSPGGMTNGLWRGIINSDWFQCKNWDDARLPDATTNVVINETANNSCNVGLSPGINPGGTANCATLVVSTNNSTVRPLNVRDNSTLNVGGLFRIQNTGGTTGLLTYLFVGAKLNAGSVELAGLTPGDKKVDLIATGAGCELNVAGDITIGAGSGLNIQGSPTVFGTLNLGGDFINLEGNAQFLENNGLVNFNGTGDQYIQNNDPNELFGKLKVTKSGGAVYLTAPITVRNELDLTQGRIINSPSELLTLNAGTTALNASNASYVQGPVKKIGNTDFTFPIGKNNAYRPAKLSGITGGAGVAFTAEYFNGNMVAPLSLAHEPALHHVSDCEHWRIDRSAGVPNAFVTLSWQDPVSCGVTLVPDLRVAYWNDVTSWWENRGNSATTGNTTAGTVTSGLIQTSFASAANYWTLASVSSENPLPIELISFTAVPVDSRVDLRWSTASEQNNHHFTVERSADAISFWPLLQVPGAGNSQQIIHYADEDRSPLSGLSYYRLRQTDLDGTTVVSDAVPVFFNEKGQQPLIVLYGNGELYLQHSFAPGSTLEVMDLTGRVLSRTVVDHEGLLKVPLDGLSRGIYLLRLSDGERVESTRVSY